MANLVKKYGISSELAQKMVDEAVAKAREIAVTENVAILDDGGNFIQGDPLLLAGIPTLARLAAYGEGFPILATARWRCPESVEILPVVDLNMPLTLALVWRRDNTSPLLANFIAEVRCLPEV